MLGIVPKISKAIMASTFLPATLRSFLCAPAGPLSIFFWAPTIKWFLIFANVSTFTLPIEMINTRMQLVMCLSGLTWTRWSFVITPRNYMLALVNGFMAGVAIYQLYRKNLGPESKKLAITASAATTAKAADKKPEEQQQQQAASSQKK